MRNKSVKIIEKGTAPHSYKINLFGVRIRFRNFFAFKNNRIILVNTNGLETVVKKIKGLDVKFLVANAVVKIYKPYPKFENSSIICGDNSVVSIGASKYKIVNSCINASASFTTVKIGSNNFIRGFYVSCTDKQNLVVNIGDNCLIANGVRLWTSDFHTVIDADTKEVLNTPAGINIGNHCWLCEDVTISKGVNLPDESIVAAKAFVTKSFYKKNTIIGGIPASIIKDANTSWSEKPYWQYANESI